MGGVEPWSPGEVSGCPGGRQARVGGEMGNWGREMLYVSWVQLLLMLTGKRWMAMRAIRLRGLPVTQQLQAIPWLFPFSCISYGVDLDAIVNRTLDYKTNDKLIIVIIPGYAREQRICIQPSPSRACCKKQLKKGRGSLLCPEAKNRTAIVFVSKRGP